MHSCGVFYRDNSLRDRFDVDDGWAVLLGSHHRYVRPCKPPFRIGKGVVDLSLLHQSPHLEFRLEYLEEQQSRYLYLMIDSAEVSSSDLAALKEVLRRRQHIGSSNAGRQKAPPITDACAWLCYLRCYDLRVRDGLSRNNVGQRVYGAPAGRSVQAVKKRAFACRVVTRAVQKVKALIELCQKGPWVFPAFSIRIVGYQQRVTTFSIGTACTEAVLSFCFILNLVYWRSSCHAIWLW